MRFNLPTCVAGWAQVATVHPWHHSRFCREASTNAGGALAHIDNIAPPLGELLKLADLARLEIHGPADHLARLREPLDSFNPAWFVVECGLD